jgi:HEPN domain-containing protein
MDRDAQHWLRIAASDVVSVEVLHGAGQDLHAMFFLQQAVEKTLKALIARQTQAAPPRIHNLHTLADLCGLKLERDQLHLLEVLNGYYAESRYPADWEPDLPTVTAKQAEG